ncbi:MAG TPA: asparaginase [Clostridiaceae bacterium]|nr:asparaginase [Clostridiaceae bacterium]
MPVKLVEVIRGNTVESIHKGDVAIVNSKGEIIHELGNAGRVAFFRSAGKPLQAIAALETGIVEEYGLGLNEIAIMVSSHSGEQEHIRTIKGMMEKTGINEDMLKCGVHEPVNREAARQLALAGESPTRLHCNCSGKHIGLIAASKLKNADVQGYHLESHPIQKDIKNIISEFCNVDLEEMETGIDGCSLPIYAVPLKNMALSYANLCDAEFNKGKYSKSQNYVISAMTMYPEMVAGKGRLDTEIMRNFGDRVISKMGAEGIYCAGIIGKNIGIAIKIDDGNSRAVGPAIIDILIQMKIIDKSEAEALINFWKPPVVNHNKVTVGKIRPVFKLK